MLSNEQMRSATMENQGLSFRGTSVRQVFVFGFERGRVWSMDWCPYGIGSRFFGKSPYSKLWHCIETPLLHDDGKGNSNFPSMEKSETERADSGL